MKPFSLKHWVIILFYFTAYFLISCKKSEINKNQLANVSNKTIKQIVFSGTLDVSNGVSQASSDRLFQRVLIPIKTNKTTFFKYHLLENNLSNKNQLQTYVISKTPITKSTDLFSIPITKEGIIAYDVAGKGANSCTLKLKHHDKELDINSTFAEAKTSEQGFQLNNANPSENVGYCVDHWWVTSDADTGEIISIEYLGYDCYGCAQTNSCGGTGGGGGGNGGNPDSINAMIFVAMSNATQIDDKLQSINTINFTHGTPIRSRKYIWRCITNPYGWNILSEEESVENKQPVTATQTNPNLWYFASLIHKTCYKIGVAVGGTVSVKQHNGTTSNLGNTNARMQLSVTLEYAGLGIPGLSSWDVSYYPAIICSIFSYSGGPVIIY